MPYSTLSVSHNEAVCVVRFDNGPEDLINSMMVSELGALCIELSEQTETKVVVFTGASEDNFIRHYDMYELAEMSENTTRLGLTEDSAELTPERPIDVAFRQLEELPQVTIAAVNGFCMGGGLELALCCDLRFACEGNFLIGLPEVHAGIFPGAGGTQRLPRAVGTSIALDMILRGRLLSPEQAKSLGLIHELVTKDVLAYANQEAHKMASYVGNGAGLRAAKKLVRSALSTDISEGIERERRAIIAPFTNKEVARALNTFAQNKTDPVVFR